MPVEALFPQGGGCFELASSGWSRVLGIDAVGGAPHCDFADEGGARIGFPLVPARSAAEALKASLVVAARSPTCTRPRLR